MAKSLLSAFAAVGLLLSLGSPASAQVFPAAGTSGDRSDRDECPAGDYLVGFGVYSGLWIDGLVIKCAKFIQPAPGTKEATLGPPTTPRSERGGKAGMANAKDFVCPANTYVSGIGFWRKGAEIQHVGVACRSISEVKADGVEFGGPQNGAPTPQNCDGSNVATGININSGKYINALGLICARPIRRILTVGKPKAPAVDTTTLCRRYAEIMVSKGREYTRLGCTGWASSTDNFTQLVARCSSYGAAAAETTKINKDTLGSVIDACRNKSGGGGKTIATVVNPTTLYLDGGGECYMVPGDKGDVTKKDGGNIFINATTGRCKGKSGKVWEGDPGKPKDVTVSG
jgi:hypothetical protein